MSETISWVDPSGFTTILTEQPNLEVEYGVVGRWMPPVEVIADDSPTGVGARTRRTKLKPREVFLPVVVQADNEAALWDELRALMAVFNTFGDDDGLLRVDPPSGPARELNCRYVGGLEGNETTDRIGGVQRCPVTLRANDPLWYEVATQTQTWMVDTAPRSFFPFSFPFKVNNSSVFAAGDDAIITNDGDWETWPVWTIRGPGSGLEIRNTTTGDSLELDYTLTDNVVITVDTVAKTVTTGGGDNLFGVMTGDFFPLAPGENAITLMLSGANSASSVSVEYRRRYLSV